MEFLKDRLMVFCSILDFGKGSKAMKLSRDVGAIGGTIFLGRGTIRNEWLNILGAIDRRKEIFITIVDSSLEESLYESMEKKFHLDKPNHGIAFSMGLKYFSRQKEEKYVQNSKKKEVKEVDYEAIFVIVDKGVSEKVLEAATEAGSTGGTVIHGRGLGTRRKETLFHIEIEPEKDIVLILSRTEGTEKIVKNIKEKVKLDEPGVGVLFIMDVTRTMGLYKNN